MLIVLVFFKHQETGFCIKDNKVYVREVVLILRELIFLAPKNVIYQRYVVFNLGAWTDKVRKTPIDGSTPGYGGQVKIF
jgi:hypothetical protein